MKDAMLKKFTTQKSEAEIMRDAISLLYDGRDLHVFLTKAEIIHKQAKFNAQAKYVLLREALQGDYNLLQFVLFRGAKNYDEVKKYCLEYAGNQKMMGMKNNDPQDVQTKGHMNRKRPEDSRIDELCRKVENLHWMFSKPTRPPRPTEPFGYECIKKGHFASQCSSGQENVCYRCNQKGHCANECSSRPRNELTCTFSSCEGCTADEYFMKRNNGARGSQDVRVLPKTDEPQGDQGQTRNVMFMDKDDSDVEEETVAAFKKTSNAVTLTKQRWM